MGSFFAVMGFGDNQYITGNAFRFNVLSNINPSTQIQPITSTDSIDPALRMSPSFARTLDFELGGPTSRGKLRAEARENAQAFREENPLTFTVDLSTQNIPPIPNQHGVTEVTQVVQQANQQDLMTQRLNEIANVCNAKIKELLDENNRLKQQLNGAPVMAGICCPNALKSSDNYNQDFATCSTGSSSNCDKIQGTSNGCRWLSDTYACPE